MRKFRATIVGVIEDGKGPPHSKDEAVVNYRGPRGEWESLRGEITEIIEILPPLTDEEAIREIASLPWLEDEANAYELNAWVRAILDRTKA